MGFRDWFTLRGIREEIKNISWPTRTELSQKSAIVLLFTFIMGVYFFLGDTIIAAILSALGMS